MHCKTHFVVKPFKLITVLKLGSPTMPQLLPTIEEFIATDIQRQGYWIVFNTSYNDVHALKKQPEVDEETGKRRYLVEEDTDEAARNDFLDYMKTNFPEVRLVNVFDRVGLSFLIWPYLGSIAIDMQQGDAVYAALSEKYNDPELDTHVNNAVLWTMRYKDAQLHHRDRMSSLDNNF
jgi:hypothetical protein